MWSVQFHAIYFQVWPASSTALAGVLLLCALRCCAGYTKPSFLRASVVLLQRMNFRSAAVVALHCMDCNSHACCMQQVSP